MMDYLMLAFAAVGVIAVVAALVYCADKALNGDVWRAR